MENCVEACLETVRANISFDFNVWGQLKTHDERFVYLFITQPPVRFVSVLSIANELNISESRVIIALFGIINQQQKGKDNDKK